MANAFFVRCDCRNRRFTGGKSRFLQEADGRKGIASAADELCGSALEQPYRHALEQQSLLNRFDINIVSIPRQDIHGDNGAFCYKGLRHSLCHGWASGPTAFLAEDVLGIHILEAGCGAIELRPKLGDLQWARGTYPTPLGILRVEHCRQPDGDIRTTWDAPAGMRVVLP